jgi:hypothetical protein
MYRIIEMSSGDGSKNEMKELIDKFTFNTYAKHLKLLMVMLDEIDTKIESAVNAKPADDEKEQVEKAFGKEGQ